MPRFNFVQTARGDGWFCSGCGGAETGDGKVADHVRDVHGWGEYEWTDGRSMGAGFVFSGGRSTGFQLDA